MDNEKMTLFDYWRSLSADLSEFYDMWEEGKNSENKDQYPESMTPGEWEEQFAAYLRSKGD